jgi:MATE family multidrug resistance protein
MPEHMKATARLAAPVAASHLSDMVALAADAIMVGQLGTVALAAATLANSVYVFGMLFAISFAIVITPLAGSAWGRGDAVGVASVLRNAGAISIAVAVVASLVYFPARPLLSLFGAEAAVVDLAVPYLLWLAASTLPRAVYGMFKQTAEAMHNTRTAMLIAVLGNLLNLGFNWVFIFGNLGAPAMGVTGAGFSTFLARSVTAALFVVVFLRADFFADVRHAVRRSRFEWESMKRTLAMGLPIAGQIMLEVSAFAIGSLIMAGLGTAALAAHNIALNLASITFMVALGLGSAATIRVSNFLGANDRPNALRAARAALLLVVGYELCTALLFFSLRNVLPAAYSADPAVLALASNLLLIAALFQLFDGVQTVALGVLRGMSDVNVPTAIAGMAYGLLTVPISYYTAHYTSMGPYGVWLGYVVGLVVASTLFVLRIRAAARGRIFAR